MAQTKPSLEAPSSIFELSSACAELFDKYLQNPDTASKNAVEDFQDRFNLWTAYIGAFASPGASLDDRLRFHDEIKAMVVKLLNMLHRNLQSALENDSTNPSTSLASQSPESARTVSNLALGSEPFHGLEAVSGALDRLHRLSTAIRRSSTSSRKEKLLAGLRPSDEDVSFEKSILTFIQGRFPSARSTLITHLLAALSFQRKRLIYQARHNLKLSHKRQNEQKPKQVAGSLLRQIATHQMPAPLEVEMSRPSPPSLVMSKTNASTPNSQRFRDALAERRKRTPSVTSTGSAAQGELFHYPDPPAISGRKHVPCPYCAEAIAASKLQLEKKVNVDFWRDHLNNDIEPYFCIADECRDPLRFFVSFQDWFTHMKTFHSTEWSRSIYSTLWICRSCPDGSSSFSDAKEFELHLGTSHGTLTETQKSVRIKRSKTRALRDQWICPLCECIPPTLSKIQLRDQDPQALTHFSRHVAAHTKGLSLLAFRFLPSTQEHGVDDGDSSDNNESIKALLPIDDYQSTFKLHGETSRGSSMGSTAFEDNPSQDRGSDEPLGISNHSNNLDATVPPMQDSGSWGFLPTFRDLEDNDVSPLQPDADPQQQVDEALKTTLDALTWINDIFPNNEHAKLCIGVDIATVQSKFSQILDLLRILQDIQQRSPSEILPASGVGDIATLHLEDYINLVNWYVRLIDWISQYLLLSDLAAKPLFRWPSRTPEGYWLWCPFCERESLYNSNSITDFKTHIGSQHKETLPPKPWASLGWCWPPEWSGDQDAADPQIRLTLVNDFLRSIASYRGLIEGLPVLKSEVAQKNKDELSEAEPSKAARDAPAITEVKQEEVEVENLDIPQRGSRFRPKGRILPDVSVNAKNRPLHTIGLWSDGFTVDNGPLHLIGESRNRDIIDCLDRGSAFPKAVLASLPPDWPNLDSVVAITRHRRPHKRKQQPKGKLIVPHDSPDINPSTALPPIPIITVDLDDKDDLQPKEPDEADYSTGSSTSAETIRGFELQGASAFPVRRFGPLRTGIVDSTLFALETTLYVLGWIELDLYAKHGNGEHLQSDFFLPVFREIEGHLRHLREQHIGQTPASLNDNHLQMILWHYLDFIGWIHAYFEDSENVHFPWVRRAPEPFPFWCPLCESQSFYLLIDYSDHMATLHDAFPPYQPWMTLGRDQTEGGLSFAPETLETTDQPVLFRGKSLLAWFCGAFKSMCDNEVALDLLMEEMMRTVDDVAEAESRAVSTAALTSTEVNVNEA